jgi:hypothetical protein
MPIAMPIGTRSAISTNMPRSRAAATRSRPSGGSSSCAVAPRHSASSRTSASTRGRHAAAAARHRTTPAAAAGRWWPGCRCPATLTHTIQASGARKASVSAVATRSMRRPPGGCRCSHTTSTQMWLPRQVASAMPQNSAMPCSSLDVEPVGDLPAEQVAQQHVAEGQQRDQPAGRPPPRFRRRPRRGGVHHRPAPGPQGRSVRGRGPSARLRKSSSACAAVDAGLVGAWRSRCASRRHRLAPGVQLRRA